MANKNTYINKENEIRDTINHHKLLIFPILVFVFICSVGINIFLFVNNKNKINRVEKNYTEQLRLLNDSLTRELELAKTQVEIKTIHEIYGRISMSKEKIKQPAQIDVWEFILSLDTWYPEYIMAQAIIESSCGVLTPQNSNNMFGMTVPKTRESVAINLKSDDLYAKYNNWKESVIDRVLWELNVFDYIRPTEEEYLKKLQSYASSPTYVNAIKSTAKQYKQ